MSRSKRTLFFIGILIIVSLSIIGSYFAIISLLRMDNELKADAENSTLTYTFNIQSLEYNGKPYGGCKVTKTGKINADHYEEVNFVYDGVTEKFVPLVTIKNAKGEDVTTQYKLSITNKYVDGSSINLKVQPRYTVEHSGLFADAYKDTALLEQGYYLLGDCSLEAEMDVSSFNSQNWFAEFNVKVVSGDNETLDFFNLENDSYYSKLESRMLKLTLYFRPPYHAFEIVEGSLMSGHSINLINYDGVKNYTLKIYGEGGNEVTYLYNVIIINFN